MRKYLQSHVGPITARVSVPTTKGMLHYECGQMFNALVRNIIYLKTTLAIAKGKR